MVLVGHSMGGIVIKKAYLLAKNNQTFSMRKDEFKGILFLATPHSIGDPTDALGKLLGMSSQSAPDLMRDFAQIHSINNDFRTCHQDLKLYSFRETRPTKFEAGKVSLLDLGPATPGSSSEHTVSLNADQ